MSQFLFKRFHFGHSSVRILPPTSNLVGFVRNPDVFFSLRWFSSGSNQQSFTVSYLIRELGFSQESALKVSERFNFDTSEKPDKVIKLFEKYGFTQTQISSLIRINAQLLVTDAEKTISPKLEFFDAKGVSWLQFAKSLSSFPLVLASSLDNQVRPSYKFLKDFLCCDEKAIATVEKYPDILVTKFLALNIEILREHGVPHSNIVKLISKQPRALAISSVRFRKIVEEVVEMGFDAKKLNFVEAILAFCCLSKSTWENKVSAYERCGWTEEEVLKAFKRYPRCMMHSEDKIMAGMDFFTNKMGLRPCHIANRPILLALSLQKRVIPRFSVFQVLQSNGLVDEVSLYALFESSEKKFLQKFVTPYKEGVPELLKSYEEALNPSNEPLVENAREICCKY